MVHPISNPRSMPSLSQPCRSSYSGEENLPPDLVRRIFSWRMSIEPGSWPGEQVQSPTSPSANFTKTKSRIKKPYLRQVASLRSRLSSATIPENGAIKSGTSHQFGEGYSPAPHHGSNPTPSTSRGAYDLPDPARNPLVTRDPVLLADDYSRIMLIYEQVNEKKRQLEALILRHPCRDATRHLLDIGASTQRIMRSLQYIVAYSKDCGYNLDFGKSYTGHCEQRLPPPPPCNRNVPQDGFIKMPQARAFSEGWKVNPL